jgi:ferredoxin-NADP reductase
MVLGGLTFSFFGLLPYNPIFFILSALFITFICLISNQIFSSVFSTPTNVESVYITALILILIINPINNLNDFAYWGFLFWVSLWAMASKYIFAINKKHVFNPAAFAVVLTAIFLNQGAGWWVGTLSMTPFVVIGGLLTTRKIRRFDLVLTFIIVALISIVGLRASDWNSAVHIATRTIFYSPLLFFAFIMLTEPLTTPPTKFGRMFYGAISGFLFSPLVHIGTIYSTPELSLLVSNGFSYIISPKQKLILKLKQKIKIANETYDFIFSANKRLDFKPGQYLEWTVDGDKSDTRGNRRYFTLASSPTEKDIRMGVKFYPNGSSFKKRLLSMNQGDTAVASQLSGEFVMPDNQNKKLVFLAGGIGITPFRSMLKYLLDEKKKRDIVMIYSNKTQKDIAYRDIITEASKTIGLKNVYTVTDELQPGEIWNGNKGAVNAEMIKREIPDYLDRYFYISGTHGMVVAFNKMLRELGVQKSKIKKDFFPGFV